MAKLPRSPIAAEVRSEYTPVREARMSGSDPVGEALTQAGDAGFEIANRMAEAKIAADAAKADIDLRSDLDKLRRELEADNETPPEQLEGIYRERASKVVAERAGGMRSPALRRAFGQQSARILESGAIDMRDVTRRKQVAGAKAEALTVFNRFEEEAKDPLAFDRPADGPSRAEAARDNNIALADRYLKSGIWDADTATEMKLRAQATYELGQSNAHVFRIKGYLDSGDGADMARADAYFMEHSGEIALDQREQVRDVIAEKTKVGLAVTRADELMAAAGNDYDKAIAEARKIPDVELRLDVESRLTTMKEQNNQGEAMRQEKVRKAGLEPLLTGGGLNAIPADVMMEADADTKKYWRDYVYSQQVRTQQMATLSAEQRAALKEYETLVTASIRGFKQQDSDLYLRGPGAWYAEEPELYEQFIQLDSFAQRTIEQDIENSITTGGKASPQDEIYSSLLKGAQFYGVDLDAMKKDNPERYRVITGALVLAAEREAQALGGTDLDSKRRKEIFGAALVEANRAEGKWSGQVAGIGLTTAGIAAQRDTEEQQRRTALNVAASAPALYRDAEEKLKADGNKNPTENEIAKEVSRDNLFRISLPL